MLFIVVLARNMQKDPKHVQNNFEEESDYVGFIPLWGLYEGLWGPWVCHCGPINGSCYLFLRDEYVLRMVVLIRFWRLLLSICFSSISATMLSPI